MHHPSISKSNRLKINFDLFNKNFNPISYIQNHVLQDMQKTNNIFIEHVFDIIHFVTHDKMFL